MIEMTPEQSREFADVLAKLDSYVAGLVEMRRFLAEHPMPGHFGQQRFYVDAAPEWDPEQSQWVDLSEPQLAERVRVMKLAKGQVEKETTDTTVEYVVRFGDPELLSTSQRPCISLIVMREKVCTPRVVRTERQTVTKYVAVEVQEDVDIVEWDCHPVLAVAEDG